LTGGPVTVSNYQPTHRVGDGLREAIDWRKAAAGATRLAAGDANAFPRKFSLFYRDQDIVMNALEAESVEIIREAVATARKPVMMYSIGKDSSVMLHLARKAFHPAPPPFPLLHIDTGWKFQAMYAASRPHGRRERHEADPTPTRTDCGRRGALQPRQQLPHRRDEDPGLKQALDAHGFDVVFGGARRDEEKSRAKERVFSFRAPGHRWDPKAQRPELWNLYNTRIQPDESIRVFPLSNWTELDIWQYIHAENIPIVPLYLAATRPVVERGGQWIMVDDERFPFAEGEAAVLRRRCASARWAAGH
jgi:sulfate adenylyltransferase subunit 2